MDQTSTATRAPGQTVAFNVRVHNDSVHTDNIRIEGPASSAGFKVSYFKGQNDITSQVVAGTYQLGDFAPDEFKGIRVEVKVRNNNPGGGTADVLGQAFSNALFDNDAVKASVTAG